MTGPNIWGSGQGGREWPLGPVWAQRGNGKKGQKLTHIVPNLLPYTCPTVNVAGRTQRLRRHDGAIMSE